MKASSWSLPWHDVCSQNLPLKHDWLLHAWLKSSSGSTPLYASSSIQGASRWLASSSEYRTGQCDTLASSLYWESSCFDSWGGCISQTNCWQVEATNQSMISLPSRHEYDCQGIPCKPSGGFHVTLLQAHWFHDHLLAPSFRGCCLLMAPENCFNARWKINSTSSSNSSPLLVLLAPFRTVTISFPPLILAVMVVNLEYLAYSSLGAANSSSSSYQTAIAHDLPDFVV